MDDIAKRERSRKIGTRFMIATAILSTLSVWVWALFGMPDDIGLALTVTFFATGLTGFIYWLDSA